MSRSSKAHRVKQKDRASQSGADGADAAGADDDGNNDEDKADEDDDCPAAAAAAAAVDGAVGYERSSNDAASAV